ncbi:carboxypeptidase-like regulatory domain-containing protein [bacterium]|nr:carboxypeptidase-like regulatory domain-containing protein [bacterium]
MRWMLGLSFLLALVVAVSADPLVVTGVVTGPDGRPLTGCRVFAMGSTTAGKYETATATTGADGAFDVTLPNLKPGGRCQVVACHGTLPVAWANVRPGEPVALCVQGPAAGCSGLVTDEAGTPIAGAAVRLGTLIRRYELHWSEYGRKLCCGDESPLATTTDAHGRFALGNLPDGAQAALVVRAPGYAETARRQIPAGASDVHICLLAPASISGHVLWQGRPIADALVTAEGAEAVTTGPDGAFTFPNVAPGTRDLSARADARGLIGVSDAPVRVSPGQSVTGVVLNVQQAAIIKGRCVEAKTKRPYAGARVWDRSLTPGGVFYDNAVSAADGTYSLKAVPGESEVVCNTEWREPPLYGVAKSVQQLHLAAGQTGQAPDILIEVEPTVQGQALLPDGTPAAGIQVGTISRIDYGVAPAEFYCARTDAQGHFALQVIAGSTSLGPPWGIVVRDAARDLAAMPFPTSADKPLTVQLQPGAWLETKVVTPVGAPVPGWPVELKCGTEHTCAIPGACSAADGTLRLGPLPAGVALRVRLADHLAHLWVNKTTWDEASFTLKAGEHRQLEPLVVEPQGRTVRGWVGDAAQHPQAGALVVGEKCPWPVVTDAQGRFELSGLPLQGKARVIAMHPTQPLFAGVSLEPDGSVEPGLVLLPPATMTVRVKQPDGTPLNTAQCGESGMESVHLISDELACRLSAAGASGSYGFSTEGGVLRLEGLVSGLSYKIWVIDRNRKFNSQELGFYVEPGQDVDLGEVTLSAK